jgi:hypothetical protein
LPVLPISVWTFSDGGWEEHENSETPYFFAINFSVKDGVIRKNFSSPNLLTMKCLRYDGGEAEISRLTAFGYHADVGIGPGGTFYGDETLSGESVSTRYTVPEVVHGQLGASEGVMVVEVREAKYEFEGHTEEQCSGAITLEVWNKYPVF